MAQVLPIVMGAASLFQNHENARRQQNAQGDANALNWEALNFQKDNFHKYSEPALQQLLALAQGYDPVAESRAATDYASSVAQDAVGKALRGFNVSQAVGGATPGNSSLQGAQQAAVMVPIAKQLAGIVADMQANATMKKMAPYQALLGQAPAGALGQAYYNSADALARSAQSMPGADYGPGSQLLGQGLEGILGNLFKTPPIMDHARGQNRYANVQNPNLDLSNQLSFLFK